MNEFLKVMEVAFFVLDQIDMLFGVWVLLGFVVAITPMRLFWSVVFLYCTSSIDGGGLSAQDASYCALRLMAPEENTSINERNRCPS
jgi:hypothetical protein